MIVERSSFLAFPIHLDIIFVKHLYLARNHHCVPMKINLKKSIVVFKIIFLLFTPLQR